MSARWRTTLGRTSKITILATGICIALAGVAYAAASPSPETLYGCVNLRTGVLRVIDPAAGGKCITQQGLLQERAITWNQAGPPGPPGLAGPGVDSLADLNGISCTTAGGATATLRVTTGNDGSVTFACPSPTPSPTPAPSGSVVLSTFTTNATLHVGDLAVAAATVSLSAAPGTDTFISVTSNDPAVQVVGGGVMVSAGSTSAAVIVNVVAATGGAVLTATLNATSLQVTVVVV